MAGGGGGGGVAGGGVGLKEIQCHVSRKRGITKMPRCVCFVLFVYVLALVFFLF